ncbi:hypothetical protein V9T40_013648 [Parthenolecanium corni]|uniref:Delta-sarcoglycan n=1 Tax=Parthenolecanium corni TaxID=536013 RepID=A0AAN9Y2N6_9HEMI
MNEDVTVSKRKPMDPVKTQIGIYGWRKRCLFLLILVLILVVVFNLCLTLWFMEVLQFTSDGIGTLKVVKGGVMLSGKAYFMDTLIASAIRSRTGKPISLVTSQNFSVSVRSSDGQEMSNFLIKNNTVRFSSPSFNITGPRGETLFSANKNEIVFGTGEVRFTGHAGAVFDSSIQTPLIRGHYKRDLTIESITRMIEVFGPSGVVLDSRAGDISVSCLADLKIESVVGAIKLDSSKVYLPRLQTVNAAREVAAEKGRNVSVYQVCVCANGKLFLSPADGECATTDNETCR